MCSTMLDILIADERNQLTTDGIADLDKDHEHNIALRVRIANAAILNEKKELQKQFVTPHKSYQMQPYYAAEMAMRDPILYCRMVGMRLDSTEVAGHLLNSFNLHDNMPLPIYNEKADFAFENCLVAIKDVSKKLHHDNSIIQNPT